MITPLDHSALTNRTIYDLGYIVLSFLFEIHLRKVYLPPLLIIAHVAVLNHFKPIQRQEMRR